MSEEMITDEVDKMMIALYGSVNPKPPLPFITLSTMRLLAATAVLKDRMKKLKEAMSKKKEEADDDDDNNHDDHCDI